MEGVFISVTETGCLDYQVVHLHMKGVFLKKKRGLFLIIVGILLFTYFSI